MTPNPYGAAADVLLRESGCTVRKYRSSNSGSAATHDKLWEIEVPHPRGPISFGVFAHEVGHQMLHRHNSLPRWREEVEAEEYALAQFDRFRLAGREKYESHAAVHLGYSFAKAIRRSKRLVAEIIATYPEWYDRAIVECARPELSKERAALDRPEV